MRSFETYIYYFREYILFMITGHGWWDKRSERRSDPARMEICYRWWGVVSSVGGSKDFRGWRTGDARRGGLVVAES